ncbi:hypothetical protein TCAL_01493 [Tigriopus californicus]|uniref:FAS1 domain-containing protein n=1 Tax=Tigriopus californicus TaxID=6832 RepID=A0A553N7C0_TIGCA|nr:uncharacterized protein LOC131884420 [Tigriopus californicus]TRY61331.1 hypothetical protein TCAL_01493 [Tigriopus californicus]
MRAWTIFVLLLFGYAVLARPNPEESENMAIDQEDNLKEAIEGPAKELPVIPDSEKLPVWELPMEHRHNVQGSLTLPNTMDIEPSVYDQLGVDLFFSMWFVFLNNDVNISDEPFTILAPINSSKTTPETLLKNEALAEEVIANHIVLGEEVKPESLIKNVDKLTIGGLPLKFKIDKNGELWVNEAKIIGWTKVKNGVIFAVDDYLFTKDIKDKLDKDASSEEVLNNEISQDIENGKTKAKTTTKTPTTTTTTTTTKTTTTTTTVTTTTVSTTTTTTTPFIPPDHWVKHEKCHPVGDNGPLFKSIVVCVEEFVDPATLDGNVDTNKVVRKSEIVQAPQLRTVNEDNESKLPAFLQDIVDVLSVLRFGSNDFLEYIQNDAISQDISDDTNYTAIIPFDEAFRAWTPIDWGFNPFRVDNFIHDTLLNHFIVGSVDQNTVENGAQFKTVGGKDITFSRVDGKLRVNDIELVEGGTPVPHGALLFINELLFVDNEMVKELEQDHGYLESGPLVIEPWSESQFLSHVYSFIEGSEEYTYMTEYMNSTPEIGEFAPGFTPTKLEDGYTYFVPRDDAFWRLFVKDATAPDPFRLDDKFRLETLKSHLVAARTFPKDVEVGHILTTTSGKTLTVIEKTGENITFNDGRQEIHTIGKGEFVYNLGTIFYVDKVLFTEASDVVAVMEQFANEDKESVEEDEPVEDFSPTTDDAVDNENESRTTGPVKELLFNYEAVNALSREEPLKEDLEMEQPRKNRKDTTKEGEEESVDVSTGEVNFPVFEDPKNLETKIMFVNNQKIAIIRQKDREARAQGT